MFLSSKNKIFLSFTIMRDTITSKRNVQLLMILAKSCIRIISILYILSWVVISGRHNHKKFLSQLPIFDSNQFFLFITFIITAPFKLSLADITSHRTETGSTNEKNHQTCSVKRWSGDLPLKILSYFWSLPYSCILKMFRNQEIISLIL